MKRPCDFRGDVGIVVFLLLDWQNLQNDTTCILRPKPEEA